MAGLAHRRDIWEAFKRWDGKRPSPFIILRRHTLSTRAGMQYQHCINPAVARVYPVTHLLVCDSRMVSNMYVLQARCSGDRGTT